MQLRTSAAVLVAICLPTGLIHAKTSLESRLAMAWSQMHPGMPAPPPCDHKDPVRAISGDIDVAAGEEQVLASRRYGVALLPAAGGYPLAWADIGCGDTRYNDDKQFPAVEEIRLLHASGMVPQDILIRLSDLGHCGGGSDYLLLRRSGDKLVTLAKLDASLRVSCGGNPGEEWEAKVEVPMIGMLKVTTMGRYRKGTFDAPTPWIPVRRTETYRLIGEHFVKNKSP